MRYAMLLLLLLSVLVFGCLSQQPQPTATKGPTSTVTASLQPTTSVQPTQTGECRKPDLQFSNVNVPQQILFGAKYDLSVELTLDQGSCFTIPKAALLKLYDGKRLLVQQNIVVLAGKTTAVVPFQPEETRQYNLTLKIEPESADENKDNNEYKFTFEVLPFGFTDTAGEAFFVTNSLTVYAQAFQISNPIGVRTVELYLRKATSEYEFDNLFVYIRPDAGGKPSGANEIVFERGFATIPNVFGWAALSNPEKVTLQPGLHWLVVKTQGVRGNMQLHALANTTFQKPEYSMKSTSEVPFNENWVQHSEGVFNFKLSSEYVLVTG